MVRKVAEGGTAMVHLGYDTWTEQWRAVKTLLPEYASRAALRHRFEREAVTMKGLSHENVVAVYDAGVDDDVAYMVMEYAEAGSIIDWIERYGPMPPRMASQVTLELCAGISAAHHHGVIHRDVKPQNLLVDRYGRCKVTDFGIAQVRHNTRMTMTGTVMGTIGYMAPEQHESAKHADERADVYSIAATFYTLLKGEAATHLFMAEPSDFEGIPTSLAEIIRRGAEYRREARFDSVEALAHAVQGALRILPPDPLDTPPLVANDTPLLDDLTPPSFHGTRSVHADHHGYIPLGSTPGQPLPTRMSEVTPDPSAEPYPSPQFDPEGLYPPEELYPDEPQQQLVIFDGGPAPATDSAPTPSLPTRNSLTRDSNRPTPKPLARWERPLPDRREWVPWLAAGLGALALLGVGLAIMATKIQGDSLARKRDGARFDLVEQCEQEVNLRLYNLMLRLEPDQVDGAPTLLKLMERFRQVHHDTPHAPGLVATARRIKEVLVNRVQPDVCTQGQAATCRELSDIDKVLEESLRALDLASQDFTEFRTRNPAAGCLYGHE